MKLLSISDVFKYKIIVLEPRPGSHIDDCKNHAVALSTISRCHVQFIHNGQIWVADQTGDINKIPNHA